MSCSADEARLTLGAEEVHVGSGQETAEQGPDEDLWADSVDTCATTEHHDPRLRTTLLLRPRDPAT